MEISGSTRSRPWPEGITQQYVIMRSQGIHVDLMGNITSGFKRKPEVKATATPPAKTDEAEADEGDAAPAQETPKGKKPGAKSGGKSGAKPGGKSGSKPGAKPRRKRRGGGG